MEAYSSWYGNTSFVWKNIFVCEMNFRFMGSRFESHLNLTCFRCILIKFA
jgi:hypothetical protein